MAATSNTNPAVIEALLNHGADIHARADDDQTPLHVAASSNTNPEVIQLLLKRGANIHAVDSGGQTACQLAQQRSGGLSNLAFNIIELRICQP